MSRRNISRSLIAGLFTGLGSIGAFAFGLAVVLPEIHFSSASQSEAQDSPAGQGEPASDPGGPTAHFPPEGLPENFPENFPGSASPETNGSPEQGGNPVEGFADGSGSGQLPGNDPVEDSGNASAQGADSPGADVSEGSADGGTIGSFRGFGFSRQGLAMGFVSGEAEEGSAIASLEPPADTPDNGATAPVEGANGTEDGPGAIETAEVDLPSGSPEDGAGGPQPDPAPNPFFLSPIGFDSPPAPIAPDGPPPPQETNQGPTPGPVSETWPETPSIPVPQSPVSEVPEPGSIGLIGLGLLGMRALRRKGRR